MANGKRILFISNKVRIGIGQGGEPCAGVSGFVRPIGVYGPVPFEISVRLKAFYERSLS